MTAISLRVDDKHLKLSFPYDPDAIDRMKDAVPAWDRSYDPQTKIWTVGKPWLPKLTEALAEGGHSFVDATAPKTTTGIAEVFGTDKAEAKVRAQQIVDDVPTHLRHRVLREIARLLYPDLYSGRR